MLNSIINQYHNKPNFSHKITAFSHEANHSLPAHTTTTLLVNYTENGLYYSRYYWLVSLDPDKFQFSTDLTYTVTNSDTGEILGLFYGFGNPDFLDFLDSLIEKGVKFELYNKWGEKPTNLLHGRYKRLKSGKWRKY